MENKLALGGNGNRGKSRRYICITNIICEPQASQWGQYPKPERSGLPPILLRATERSRRDRTGFIEMARRLGRSPRISAMQAVILIQSSSCMAGRIRLRLISARIAGAQNTGQVQIVASLRVIRLDLPRFPSIHTTTSASNPKQANTTSVCILALPLVVLHL